MKFKRLSIVKEVVVTVECLKFDQKYKLTVPQAGQKLASKAAEDIDTVKGDISGSYYVLAIFDAIMNAMAKGQW